MSFSDGAPKPRLLLVAYDFPPVTSAGMYRIVGMTKYLQRKNWDITVLTVKDTYVYKTDASLKLIPDGVRVVRTSSFEFRRFRRSVMAKLDGRNASSVGGEVGGAPAAKWRTGTLRRLFEIPFNLVDRILKFPDAKTGWFFPLLLNAWRIMRRERFDIVLSSSPPHSLHLPLLFLRKLRYFKWVADFRDPWTIPNRSDTISLGFGIRRSMEKTVISTCDSVVANTAGNRDALLRELGRAIEGRVTVVTNGFDVELDVKDANTESEPLDCDMVYMGEVYPGMLDVYSRAVRFIKDTGKCRMPKLWVYGRSPDRAMLRQVQDNGLGEWIAFKGRVSYERSRRIIADANGLLLLLPHKTGHETWVPSKLYSYLFSSAPILALVPDGDAARIVEETDRGVVIRAQKPEEVAAAITEFLKSVDAGTVTRKAKMPEVNRYRMENVISELDGVLRRCTREKTT